MTKPVDPRGRIARVLTRSAGALSTATNNQMDQDRPWLRQLAAEDRAWVGQIVQAGVADFIDWYRQGGTGPLETTGLAATVFGVAPRALTGSITLQQTVELVRISIETVEHNIDEILDPEDVDEVRHAVLRYGREVAFATAEVYARAAESRGAWDARLEALVLDAVLRAESDDQVLSRANAVGWQGRSPVVAVLGAAPQQRTDTDLFDAVRRCAREAGLDALCAVQGDRFVVLLGGADKPEVAAALLTDQFGDGPIVVGDPVDDLGSAHESAAAALAGFRAATGWPDAPRPIASSDLLPERALAGDETARTFLVEEVFGALAEAGGGLVETLGAYLDSGRSIEATARALFVHSNTVRYRLGRIATVTGYSPLVARESLTLQVAQILGRQNL